MPEIKMGNNSANNVRGVTSFNLCKMAGYALYCTKFCEIISNSIKVIEQTPFLYWKLQRGIIPQKNVGRATVVNLCMSSGHALYLCQVSWNNIKRYQSYRVSTISIVWKLLRGIIPPKMQVEQLLLISARRMIMLYISTKFCEIISNGIKVIEWTRFLYWKLQRGIIPQKK